MVASLKDQKLSTADLSKIDELSAKKQVFLLENYLDLLDTVENQLEEFDDVTCEKLQGDQDLKEYVSDSLALIDVYNRLKT